MPWSLAALVLVVLACPLVARADVLQMPIGSDFVTLPGDGVLCGNPPDGFVLDASRKRLRPRNGVKAGYEAAVQVAAKQGSCEASTTMTLIVTGVLPRFDLSSVTVAIDAGQLELSGKYLEGARIGYAIDGKVGADDVCFNTARDQEDRETCAVSIPQDLPADPRRFEVLWAPAGGRIAPDMRLFDERGQPVTPERMRLPVARVLLQRMFPSSRTVNLSTTDSRVQLEHPDAVSSVECGNARCEVRDGKVIVGSVSPSAQTLSMRIRFLPRVFISRGDAVETTVSETLSVLRCPLDIASGEPLRGVDDLQILVRLDPSCGADVDDVRWTVSSDPVEATRVEVTPEGTYVLLWVGRIARDRINVVASRGNGTVLAAASAKAIAIPTPTTALSLPGFGDIDFIPKNRDADLTISHIEGVGKLVPISMPGAYSVSPTEHGFTIRGVAASSGYASLRFGYRSSKVPPSFADVDLAHVVDPVQRPIREASVPASIGGSSVTDKPVIELHCLNEDGKLIALVPGTSEHIPFEQRNSCRLTFHRDRIAADSGEQRLQLAVTVTGLGGSERGEAHINQQLRMRHGPETDVIWLRGAKEQFDRIDVHVDQVLDEALYVSGSQRTIALTSVQWSVITEDADFRFYATATIPGSLYRFSSDPGDLGTGPLSLNFGVLSRLTWLDSEGHEGLVGLEAGVMAMGLATDRERQLALVAGLGIAIPIGNPNQPTQAAINIHAWLAYTVGDRTAPLLNDEGAFERDVKLNPWAFVFGPSITVGSIGVFL